MEVVRSIEVVVKELAEICSIDSHSYSQDQTFESLRAEQALERSLREVSYGNTSLSVLYFLYLNFPFLVIINSFERKRYCVLERFLLIFLYLWRVRRVSSRTFYHLIYQK